MDKYEIEWHHIVFAIASIITSMIFTVLITPSSLASLVGFIIALLLMVKLLTLIIGVILFGGVKEFYRLIKHKKIDPPKAPLESGDITLTATVITTGAIVMSSYTLLKTKYPIMIADGVNAMFIITGITIITFAGVYFFTKYVPPNDIF